MIRYLYILIAFVGLFFSAPAIAEDVLPEATETTEDAEAPATEGGEDAVAPATEGGEDAEAPATEGGEDASEAPDADAENTAEAADELVDGIESIDQATEEAFALVDAIKSKNWPLAVGLGLMLLVFVANKIGLKSKVGPKALPWVAMAIAVAGTVGTGLMAGLGWADSLVQGVLTGVAAIGGWELLFKHILGGKSAEEAPAAE